MNKQFIAASAVLFLSIMSPAVAVSISDSIFAEAFVGGGFSTAGGSFPKTMETEAGFSRTIGLFGGYGLNDSIMLTAGAEYCSKPLNFKSTDHTLVDTKTLYHFNFVSFSGGARYFFNSFYGEAGLFYGVRAGDQQMDIETAASNITTNMRNNGAHVSNDYGFYVGTGYLFAIKKDLFLDLGARFECGLSSVYHSSDTKLMTRNLSLRLGVSNRF